MRLRFSRRLLTSLLVMAVLLASALALQRIRQHQVELVWTKHYGGHSNAGHLVALGDDGLLEYGSHQNLEVYGLDGRKRWEFIPPDPPGMVSGVVSDGTQIYVGTNSNYLYALDL